MKYFFFLFLFIFGRTIYAQDEQIVTVHIETSVDLNFDENNIYYKETGIKIPKKVFYGLVKENPNLNLEKEFDEEGRLIRYLYDPNNQNGTKSRTRNKNVDINEDFPNFILTTIEQEKLNLKELRGTLVILRFELCSNDFRFKKHEIRELDEKINVLENKEDVNSIIIFQCSENEVKEGFDLKNSNFELVANGQNFIDKYGISRFPLTLLIDQNGILIKEFTYSEDIVIGEYLKK